MLRLYEVDTTWPQCEQHWFTFCCCDKIPEIISPRRDNWFVSWFPRLQVLIFFSLGLWGEQTSWCNPWFNKAAWESGAERERKGQEIQLFFHRGILYLQLIWLKFQIILTPKGSTTSSNLMNCDFKSSIYRLRGTTHNRTQFIYGFIGIDNRGCDKQDRKM